MKQQRDPGKCGGGKSSPFQPKQITAASPEHICYTREQMFLPPLRASLFLWQEASSLLPQSISTSSQPSCISFHSALIPSLFCWEKRCTPRLRLPELTQWGPANIFLKSLWSAIQRFRILELITNEAWESQKCFKILIICFFWPPYWNSTFCWLWRDLG